mgnify:CR=1 FL=1
MVEIEKPRIECEDNGDTSYGKYVVEPLERGYGITLGNSLRRILLSSLPGCAATSIKIAGDDFDEAIVRYMRKKHNLLIGERTAEDMKIKIGSCYKRPEPDFMDVRGRNLVTGLPKTVNVSSEEMEEALKETTA